jgi:hypothetical protein
VEQNANPQMDLVCCILTNNRKDRYDAIEKVCVLIVPFHHKYFPLFIRGRFTDLFHLDASLFLEHCKKPVN